MRNGVGKLGLPPAIGPDGRKTKSQEGKEEEVKMDDGQSAMIYMMLWAAVEALDARWSPPSNWAPEA